MLYTVLEPHRLGRCRGSNVQDEEGTARPKRLPTGRSNVSDEGRTARPKRLCAGSAS